MSRGRHLLLLAGCLALTAFAAREATRDEGFDHVKHAKLFPTCQTCHAGALDSTAAMWPRAESCANCHDGKVEDRVDWNGRAAHPTNLRFTHADHARQVRDSLGADSTYKCMQCHADRDAEWMTVRRPVPRQCFDCHRIQLAGQWTSDTSHVNAPESACATCHLALAEATTLPDSRIAGFAKPASHDVAGFSPGVGHGELAGETRDARGVLYAVAPSCQTCHARDFCLQCHVDAPEQASIQALAPDPRSLAIEAELSEPASHESRLFLVRHGGESRKSSANCVTCHARESCLACHRSSPGVATSLHLAEAGRAAGATIERRPPATHVVGYADRHAGVATASPSACTGCHARSDCLECHRPSAAAADGYHPGGFLVEHPSAAYNRESDCAECHNGPRFCTACHLQGGFTSTSGILQGRFHAAQTGFRFGHGQAARQAMESCVTCHSESDCLACHSAQGGRGFNPHGPGFDADRLRKRNPQTCGACHGRTIPRD